VFDLLTEICPITTYNFLKLCQMKYYNNYIMAHVYGEHILEIDSPDRINKNGVSFFGAIFGEKNRFFREPNRIRSKNSDKKKGRIVLLSNCPNGSWFALSSVQFGAKINEENFSSFGEASEGFSILEHIQEAAVNLEDRTARLVHIKHALILNDPFSNFIDSTKGQKEYMLSPDCICLRSKKFVSTLNLLNREEMEEQVRIDDAKNHSVILEMVGDIPAADIKPPHNVLFICKLNQITKENDLKLIFSQYGNICTCDIIRDWKTGESLGYGFVGFDSVTACEQAYFGLNNAIIDDRRIKVDFSQSVAMLWKNNKILNSKINQSQE